MKQSACLTSFLVGAALIGGMQAASAQTEPTNWTLGSTFPLSVYNVAENGFCSISDAPSVFSTSTSSTQKYLTIDDLYYYPGYSPTVQYGGVAVLMFEAPTSGTLKFDAPPMFPSSNGGSILPLTFDGYVESYDPSANTLEVAMHIKFHAPKADGGNCVVFFKAKYRNPA